MKKRKTTQSLVIPSDVPAALEALGVPVEKVRGDEVDALCPMHKSRTGKEDSRPSWGVNTKTGLHSCFSCGYSGNFVGLVIDLTGMSVEKALAWIKRQGPRRRAEFVEYQAPEPAPLDEFTAPPPKALMKRQISADAAEHYGVRWDKEDPAWIIPIRGPEGEYRGYQRKSRHRVLNVPPGLRKRDTFFGIEHFSGYRAILVESPLDVVRLHTEGLEGGLAVFGSSVSPEQEQLLFDIKASSIVIALDADTAGKKAAEKLLGFEQLRRYARLYFFRYPGHGKDPGDLTGEEIWQGVINAEYY